ncbi:NADH-quinone oxidoreductase subunit H domain protein [Mycobacterium ulcerans str. Harvey]|uniref:NADH-quinone oxidoreductase subunit H domain protein n=1 Tax=Mycobacterium ulcerans str. Harvey TaxID=1299332 RepID=A0ABN0RA49_MYCUL|nr:NADH-quinone oxidoreductase subunit H domain protein [Mycobacterium ulcerans str. Harvey]
MTRTSDDAERSDEQEWRHDRFGHDVWWLVVAKAIAIFVFLMLTVLVAILAERKLLAGCNCAPAQTGWGPRLAAKPGRRNQAGAQREHHPRRHRSIRLLCRPDHLGDSRVHRVAFIPFVRWCRCSGIARRCS